MKYSDTFIVNGVELTREHDIPFKIYVSFPLFVNVEVADISVTSVVNSDAALTGDSFSGETLTLEVTIVMDYPNMFRGPAYFTTPNGVTRADSEPSILPVVCALDAGTCQQEIEFGLNLAVGQCNYDGIYSVVGSIYTCRDSLECTHVPVTINFTISTSSICGVAGVQAAISGVLKSYQDEAHALTKSAFNLGDYGYFFADISSQGSTVFLNFVDLTAVLGTSASIPLLTNGEVTGYGVNASLTHDNSARTFSVYFTSRVFSVPASGSHTYTFKATCSLVFAGNEKRIVEYVFAADGSSVSASTKLKLSAAAPAPAASETTPTGSTPNQAALIGGIVGGVGFVGLLTVGIAFMVRRYRNRKTAANGLVNNSA
jgi:hypothetical protein